MIIFGVAATSGAPIDGLTLMPGAVDCDQLVPLYYEHRLEVGWVISLSYRGDRLLALAETNHPDAKRAGFMSPTVRAVEHSGGRVTRARLIEVSLTAHPKNPHCRVLERRDRDPLIDLGRRRAEFYELMQHRVQVLQKMVREIKS